MTRNSPVGEFKYPQARGDRDIERIAPFVRIDLVAYTYRGPGAEAQVHGPRWLEAYLS